MFLSLCCGERAPGQDRGAAARPARPENGAPGGEEGEAEPPGPAARGILRGTVKDAGTGEAVSGARVRLLETDLEATSAADGGFELRGVPVGSRGVEVSRPGYRSRVLAAEIREGERTAIDAALEAEEPETVEVRGALRSGTRMTIEQRQAQATAQEKITREEISRTTDSDVAEATQRLTGIYAKDDKFVFVRGLGERYSQTLLNNSYIPSPEPDKRVIPLDLFPVTLVESITVTKTYSPDLPGEFAGGSVGIVTIDVPDAPFLKLSLGVEYRDGTTFEDFATYDGGKYDLFAIEDGTRALPNEVPAEEVKVGAGGRGLTPEEVQTIGRSFKNIWDVQNITAPPNHKLGLSFGDRFGSPGGPALGVVGAINWGNKYQTILDEKFRIVKNAGNIQNPDPFVFNDFSLDTSTFEAELSGALNLTLEFNEAQRVGLRNLYTRSSEDRVRFQQGFDGQAQRDIQVTQLRYVERSLLSSQLFGEHLLIGDLLLEWRGSYALSQRDQPDTRQVRYDFIEFINDFQFQALSSSGSRDFYQLDENIYDGGLDLSIPFNPFGITDEKADPSKIVPDQRIKFGGAAVFRDRDFDSRLFRFLPSSIAGQPVDENGNPIDLTGPPEEIFQDENINPSGFVLTETTRSTDNYEAEQTILAGYAMADFRLLPSLRLQGGARVEDSDQEVTSFRVFGDPPEESKTDLQNTDVMPAVNLIWAFLADMQLRLGGSQTVSRPEFRELAEFEYTDVAGGYTARGNPDLQRAKIWNADLRWEWFPSPGDIISASLFYKKFQDPIEQVIIPQQSSLLTTWENAEEADLYGVEIELRKNLGFLRRELKNFSLITNFAYLESEVTTPDNTINAQTNDKRPLEGQPDYLFNAGLLFDSREWGLQAAILANTQGERITAVGAFGVDDEKEQPRWSLDASIAKTYGKATIKLSLENLLDDKYEFTQGDVTTREYRKGFTIGLSYSYSF